ncbi:MAG: acetate/propionate family kinase [Acidobacteriaceae bacterium]|nr:acetate/propionate family kinase [Acidobacteriaceae bacterium]
MSAAKSILVLNSGSSSLKFGLFRPGSSDEVPELEGSAEGIGRSDGSLRVRDAEGKILLEKQHLLESQEDALRTVSSVLKDHGSEICAVGHRVVHGGPHLVEHQRITSSVIETLEQSVHFAPLHIPQSLKLLKQAQKIFSSVPHFACFDTAFHRTLPELSARFPLPNQYFEQGVRRYGFHGLSYESLVHRLGSKLPARAVFAHLGNGSSLAAVHSGCSIDTTMGLTPAGGVLMGSRSGDLDPGLMIYLARTEKKNPDQLEEFINHNCGLAGLCDGESDMQALLERDAAGDSTASLAVNAFCTTIRKTVGAYAALMGGIDLLVFTGGIGLHSEAIRHKVCDGLTFLGLKGETDPASNVLALKTEEELQIARHVRRLLSPEEAPVL